MLPWRKVFNAIEGPISAASESWVQSETFMDLASLTFKLQRRLIRDFQRATEQGLHAFGVQSRGDLTRLVNQVASVERRVRELQDQLDRADARETRPRAPRARPRKASSRSRPRKAA